MRPALATALQLQLLALLWLLLGLPCSAQSGSATSNNDKALLLAFKATFSNGNDVLVDWLNTTEPCVGPWLGITCNQDGRVIKIELTSRGLDGTIPAGGWVLPENLLTLDMYQNRLSGTLPSNLTLPAGMQGFFLDDNMLTGTIPEQWILPENLTGMYLAGGNNLNGTLPFKLVLPPKMEKLQLGGTELQGTISGSWKLPDSLKFLYLQGSQLTGQIPEDWKLPINLQKLWLYKNRLTGTLPFRLALPPNLSDFEISFNNISGTISSSWKLPESLQWLDLGENQLTGTIPSDLHVPAAMSVVAANGGNGIGLYSNQLRGSLPSWPNLKSVILYVKPDNAGLCGEVPDGPTYKIYDKLNYFHTPLLNLSSCPPGVYAPVAPPPGSQESNGSSSTAAIVGGVVGGVAGIALVGALGWWLMRRKRQRQPKPELDTEKGGKGAVSSCSTDNFSLEHSKLNSSGSPTLPDAKFEKENGGSLAEDPLIRSILAHLSKTRTKRQSGLALVPANPGSESLSSGSSGRRLNVDVKLWMVNFEDLVLKNQIGRGSFGRVYLAQWKESAPVAVKLLLGDADGDGDVDKTADMVLSLSNPVLANLQQEASMGAALRHPNVLGFLGVCTAPPCLVLEYCPRGSLYDMLRQAKTTPSLMAELNWPRRLELALGTASGILYLHTFNPPLVHRDLRSPNVLVANDWTAKVSDFNLSRILGEASAQHSAAVTNPRWLAPEVLGGESHSFASDVYSFGIILYELLTFKLPWDGLSNPWQVVKAVMEGCKLDVPQPEEVPGGSFNGMDAYVQLMQACWAQDPWQRPNFSDITAELCRLLVEVKSQQHADGNLSQDSRAQVGMLKRCTWDEPEPVASPFVN